VAAADTIVEKRRTEPDLAAIADGFARLRAYSRRFFPLFLTVARFYHPAGTLERWNIMARAMVVQTGHETAWGAGLYNNNVSNIMWNPPTSGNGPRFASTDHHVDGTAFATYFRAYGSRMAGVIANAVYVKNHTPAAWKLLTEGDVRLYYVVLRASGYFEGFGEPDSTYVAVMTKELESVEVATKDMELTRAKASFAVASIVTELLSVGAQIFLNRGIPW